MSSGVLIDMNSVLAAEKTMSASGGAMAQAFLRATRRTQRSLSAFLFCVEHSGALKTLGADVIRKIMAHFNLRLDDFHTEDHDLFWASARKIFNAHVPREPLYMYWVDVHRKAEYETPASREQHGSMVATQTHQSDTATLCEALGVKKDLAYNSILFPEGPAWHPYVNGELVSWHDMLCIVTPRSRYPIVVLYDTVDSHSIESECCERYAAYCALCMWEDGD
jgi:hypothetical protein